MHIQTKVYMLVFVHRLELKPENARSPKKVTERKQEITASPQFKTLIVTQRQYNLPVHSEEPQ